MSEVQEIKNYWVVPGIKPATYIGVFDDVVNRINTTIEEPLTTYTRKRNICEARQLACYILKEKGYTSTFIGRKLGIDHATVYHSEKAIKNLLDYDKSFIDRWKSILESYDIDYNHTKNKKEKEVICNVSCCYECINYDIRKMWCNERHINAFEAKKPSKKCLKYNIKKVRES